MNNNNFVLLILCLFFLSACTANGKKLSVTYPAISRDNQNILFEGSCGWNPEKHIASIYQVRIDGTQLTKLTEPFGYSDGNPIFGNEKELNEFILFSSYMDKEACGDIGQIKAGNVSWLSENGNGGSSLVLDHRGEYLYFASICENGKIDLKGSPKWNIYRISLNNKNIEKVTNFDDFHINSLSLSHDNQLLFYRIAYDKNDAKHSIWTFDLKTKKILPIKPDIEQFIGKIPSTAKPFKYNKFYYPIFSPDGNSILFVWPGYYQGYSGSELYTMNLDTNKVNKLTNLRKYIVNPAYSPDGTKIVFSVGEEYKRGAPTQFSMWTMNADGSSLKKIEIKNNQFCK